MRDFHPSRFNCTLISRVRIMKYDCMMQRLLANSVIDSKTGCWLWISTINNCGYGKINVYDHEKKCPVTKYAHRVSYELFKGVLRRGFELHHVCMLRHCINPEHLRQVRHRTNIREIYTVKTGQALLFCDDR